ncbi:acyl-CoA dehydrogenase C-terminal domain-containing protein [Simiduia agarivorans]|uniref:3-methylmercaptopropionyl-CoA dehydrogenase n=1 Tax=Simiduia agarivorans (strain DSM 21679 / JCM 13881 / BCRC 17597 / SA1) TaxID=1117647 RepID=K4KLU4_SIMAS|nr:acyl-CoA dehydrogenase C-terminal domain-containing protein [Simiduia agarivorans]AFU99170.1 acyl-CoA dehydrogenase [Simiduia agarivorans SA1 = DSM 21679]
MADYQAPLRDMRFVLNEVFKVNELWASLPRLAETVDADTADAILEEAGKIASATLAPLNREADEQGCDWNEGEVTTPHGFKEVYQLLSEGGWMGLGGNPEYGGMGMPKVLVAQFEEMIQGACMSFGLSPMLNAGACVSIDYHASEALKQKYLPNMYAGTWAGAMDLTEPHAGTDLGIIRTKAEPNADGSYNITGTKIFITWGEHDMAENIIHLVLAKLPDAPAGPKGISLFLVPKVLVNDDGSLGERNHVACGSIEKKMGIKASATCVMNFDGAKGWLVGELNQGLACMFTMMNYERVGVGIQGLGAAEASYQSAVEYARERIQSRSPAGAQNPDKAADPIIVHPDVRRMLMIQRAYNEAGRAFSTYAALWLDISKYSDEPEQKALAENMVALLTPVVKAFITDKSLESAIHGQQVFGGHGFIREWGQEQLVRDIRITQIYEGTNGIQAMDLMGRKTVMNGGEFVQQYLNEIRAFADSAKGTAAEQFVAPLMQEVSNLQDVTEAVIARAKGGDRFAVGAAAVDYLHLFGYVSYAYMWAKMVAVAGDKLAEDQSFYQAKIDTAKFFYSRLLPQTRALSAQILAGGDSLMALDAAQF